jgi:hypothetical protein
LLFFDATRLIGDLFRLQVLGRHAVKGLAEPVEAWAVEGISPSEGRFEAVRGERLTGFVGREHELGLLMERWSLMSDCQEPFWIENIGFRAE